MAIVVTVTVLAAGTNPFKPGSPLPDRAGGQDYYRRRPSRLPIAGLARRFSLDRDRCGQAAVAEAKLLSSWESHHAPFGSS
jgi:hypothetical protein